MAGIVVNCDLCDRQLEEQGGLAFSPPNDSSEVKKCHLCVNCWARITTQNIDAVGQAIVIISNVDAPEAGWPHQTEAWQAAARRWLDEVAKE